MWNKVGIVRDAQGLKEAIGVLDWLAEEHARCGLADGARAFNLTWHDWLNQESQILVSQAIARSALARTDSRGAHYRIDHPETGNLATSRYTTICLDPAGGLRTGTEPVLFTIVEPGRSLLDDTADAPAAAQ
jgi:fumarate reductase flavoprotein subunit